MIRSRSQLDLHYVRKALFGFSIFIVLCGIKTTQIMSKPPKRTRAHWSEEETYRMLDLLIEHKPKMAQSWTFPPSVFTEVAKKLEPDKHGPSVFTKWQALKRTYKSIEAFSHHSGCHYDPIHGANVRTQPEIEAWDAFIAVGSINSREMAPYRNIGWPFYLKMVELSPDGAYAHTPGDEEVFDDDELQLPSSPGCYSMPEEPGSSNVSQPILNPANCDIDLNDLLQLGQDIVSPNPTTQNAALHSALSILSRVSSRPALYTNPFSSSDSRVLSFSDMSGIRPPSSRTSLVSSGKISKPKLVARTPAASAGTSSLSSSAAVSRRSKSTHSRTSMANTAAMTGITYAIDRAVDRIEEMQTLFTLLSSSPSPHVATPSLSTFSSTPPGNPSQSTVHLARMTLMDDVGLDPTIRGKLAVAFLDDVSLCHVYSGLTDSLVRHAFALNWYESKFPPPPSGTAQSIPKSLPPTYGNRDLYVASDKAATHLKQDPKL